MSFYISGIGTAVPYELITQEDAARLAVELVATRAESKQVIQAVYRRTGVKKRHSSIITSSSNGHPAKQSFFPIAQTFDDRGPTTGQRMRRYAASALELATRAASDALSGSQLAPDEIMHLVTVSCTGFNSPGVDISLVKNLGLKSSVSRTHIGFMGCHGALNGLRVASALNRGSQAGNVLLCCVELCTIHHQYLADAQQVVANALFSDGAAAVVGSKHELCETHWRLVDQFSTLLPNTADLMAWRIGDHGFEMQLSPAVPSVIKQELRHWLGKCLARHSLGIEDIRSWAIHPGGPRILTACADSLVLDHNVLKPSQSVLSEYGNMSSPTVLFILKLLQASRENLPCVVLAFGPGLTIEAALFA